MDTERTPSPVRQNVWKLYAVLMANGALLYIPVVVPFYLANGLNLAQVFYLQAVFTVANMVLEIPSGYLSDRWGRKNTLVLGSLFGVLGMAMYAASTGFWGFFVANILMAVLVSCHSGTIEAMTYDTLLELGESDSYRKTVGHQLFWSFLAQGVLSVVGGLLATVSLRAPVYATVLPLAVALLIVLTLREPSRHKLNDTRHLAAMWRIATTSLVHNIPLRSIIALSAVLSTITLSLVWLSQPYQTMAGLPLALFGLAHAIMMVGGAFAARMTHRAQQWVDDRLFLVLIAALIVGCYLVLGSTVSLWAMAFLLLGRSAFGAFSALIGDIVNSITASDVRATVLSVQNFAYRTVFAVVSPLLGYATGMLDLSHTLFYAGIASGVVLALIFTMMRRVWRDLPS